ncbi:hypothetical protein D3C80_1044080 [compost metagenome]
MANTALLRAGRIPLCANTVISVSGPPLPPGVAQMANSVAITVARHFNRPSRLAWSPNSRRRRAVLITQHEPIIASSTISIGRGKACRRSSISRPPSSSGISNAASKAASSQARRIIVRCPGLPARRPWSWQRGLRAAGVARPAANSRGRGGDACPLGAAPGEWSRLDANCVHAVR